MARFLYQARDARGQMATGTLTATSQAEASEMLRAEGKAVVKLAPAGLGVPHGPPPGGGGGGGASASARGAVAGGAAAAGGGGAAAAEDASAAVSPRGIKRQEVILFAHQMAVMVETGVPLSEALDCCAAQASTEGMKAVLASVSEHVHAGGALSAALAKHGKVFPNIMVSLIRASELSGTMGVMLDRVSKYLAKEHQTLRQVRGALMYPAFLLCMAVSATIFLLGFVLPKFAKIYESRQAVLPGPTRLLLGISNGLTSYWYLWLGLVAAGVAGVALARRSPAGKRGIDSLKLHAPVLGKVFSQLYLSRACRTMGTLLSAGVSMLDTVAIIKQVTGNRLFDDLWDKVDERLQQGSQLSEPLANSPLIPKSVSQMIFSGEKSGRLGQVMIRVAEFTEAEFDLTVKTATQFIEPVIIGLMGGIIGFVAISLLMPIFSVGQVMAKG